MLPSHHLDLEESTTFPIRGGCAITSSGGPRKARLVKKDYRLVQF